MLRRCDGAAGRNAEAEADPRNAAVAGLQAVLGRIEHAVQRQAAAAELASATAQGMNC